MIEGRWTNSDTRSSIIYAHTEGFDLGLESLSMRMELTYQINDLGQRKSIKQSNQQTNEVHYEITVMYVTSTP